MHDREYYAVDQYGQIKPKWVLELQKFVRALFVRVRWGINMIFSSKTRKHYKFIDYWNSNLDKINKLRRQDVSIHRDYYWCNGGIIEQEVKMFIMIGNAYDIDLLIQDRHMNDIQSNFLKEILVHLSIPMVDSTPKKYITHLDKAYPNSDQTFIKHPAEFGKGIKQ